MNSTPAPDSFAFASATSSTRRTIVPNGNGAKSFGTSLMEIAYSERYVQVSRPEGEHGWPQRSNNQQLPSHRAANGQAASPRPRADPQRLQSQLNSFAPSAGRRSRAQHHSAPTATALMVLPDLQSRRAHDVTQQARQVRRVVRQLQHGERRKTVARARRMRRVPA